MEKDFDLNLLRMLVALDDTRSVTRAADSLSMSQSGFSSALARLRKQFSDALFIRTAGGMEPTPRGRQMIEVAHAVLSQVQDYILTAPHFEPASAHTSFTLAMSDVAEVGFLPRLVRHLQEAAPHARVDCIPISHEALPHAMEAGIVDLALGVFPGLGAQSFFQQRLQTHTFACVMRHDHPLTAGPLTVEGYASASHAVINSGVSPATRQGGLVGQHLKRFGIERIVKLVTTHHLSLPAIVSGSDLIATVPIAACAFFEEFAKIKIVALPFEPPSVPVKQHWHRIYHHDPRNQWLRTQIARLFTDASDEWLAIETVLYGPRRVRSSTGDAAGSKAAQP